jgi:hypothetical protein
MGHKFSKEKREKRKKREKRSIKSSKHNLELELEQQFPSSDSQKDYDIFEELKNQKSAWILMPYNQFDYMPYYSKNDVGNQVVICNSKKLKTS